MRILFIGPQGSGKSTQAKLLSENLGVPLISTGEIFRKISAEDSEFGKGIKKTLDEGKLVDDEMTAKIVENRLNQDDCLDGFILDGYPRNMNQIELFDPNFDKVIYLNTPKNVVLERLLKRGREDDTENNINERLKIYFEQTEPILNFYRDLEILVEIDGAQNIEDIQKNIREEIKH